MVNSEDTTRELFDQLLEPDAKHFARLREDAKNAGKGVKTGFKLHSKKADGSVSEIDLWIPKYAVTMMAARTGGGKTTWMTNLAMRMALGGSKGFFITLEEPAFAIRAKMMATHSRTVGKPITSWDATGAIAGRNPCQTMEQFDKEVMRNLRIVDANQTVDFDKCESATVMYQPQWISNLIAYRNSMAGQALDFVVIDFGQLMETMDSDNSNSYQRMKGVMQAVKNIAGGLGIAVIIGAQLKRECAGIPFWDWEPEMIRDGSDMEQAASLILAVGSDKEYPDKECTMALRYLKNRNGPKNVAGMFKTEFECNYIPLDGQEPIFD